MKLTSMKRTKAEAKKRENAMNKAIGPGEDSVPYGLHVSLDNESLDKLGMDKMPKVGSKMHMHAKVHVASVSDEHSAGGERRRRLELHIHHMGLEPEAQSMQEGAKGAIDDALESMKK